jgi:hypothetical protein
VRAARADLQAAGTVAPDSKAIAVRIEQVMTNPKNATQYTLGDIVGYKQGSPKLEGIPNDSAAVVVSTSPRFNQLTARTSHGDEVTDSPHLTQARQRRLSTAIGDGIELRLDKGPAVKLTADQARQIEHGYIASLIGAICPVFLGFAAWAIARFEH